MHLIPSAIAPTPSLHLARSVASSTLNPIFFIFSSTCFFHVYVGRPRFRGPFTSNMIAFFKMLSSSLLTTCSYHLTPFALAILSKVSFRPSIFISSSVFFLSISFTPHIDLTIALSVLLKISISFSLKHHVSLPCNIADLTQLRYTIPFIFKENLLPSNNSLNFIQPILTLAVTAVSHPPLAFSLISKITKTLHSLHFITQYLHWFFPSPISSHLLHTNCCAKLQYTFFILVHLA